MTLKWSLAFIISLIFCVFLSYSNLELRRKLEAAEKEALLSANQAVEKDLIEGRWLPDISLSNIWTESIVQEFV
jgi:hypothetical protein